MAISAADQTIIDRGHQCRDLLNRIGGYPAFTYGPFDPFVALIHGAPPRRVEMELPKSAIPGSDQLPLNCINIIRQFQNDNHMTSFMGLSGTVQDGDKITLPKLIFLLSTPEVVWNNISEPFAAMMQKILLIATPVSVLENLMQSQEKRKGGAADPAAKLKLAPVWNYARKPFGRRDKAPFATTDEMIDALIETERSQVTSVKKGAEECLDALRDFIPALAASINQKREATCTRIDPRHGAGIDGLDF